MANANIPRGLVPVRHRNGAPYNGSASIYYVPASYGTALFVGDPVITVSGSADANGIQTVALATAAGANVVLGPILSLAFGVDSTNAIPVLRDSKRYHLASTAGYVLVADDPTVLFEIQEDSIGGNVGAGAVGKNASLISGAGSTVTGWSGWMLDSSTAAAGGTLQLRIIAPVLRADNDISSASSNAKWLVSILQHQMLSATGI